MDGTDTGRNVFDLLWYRSIGIEKKKRSFFDQQQKKLQEFNFANNDMTNIIKIDLVSYNLQ